jgi:hypothetical protein
MKKQERLLWALLAAVIFASACKHKPAYSEIDANKNARTQNQNVENQAAAAQPAPTESPAAPQPSPAAHQRPSVQRPSFLDARGEITDLPNYPGAQRTNAQIGPVQQGVNTATFVSTTHAPMDKIAAFFDQSIKNNHWTVTDRTIDPELSEWTLEKGKDNSGRVRATKDQTGRVSIIIIRGERLQEPGK